MPKIDEWPAFQLETKERPGLHRVLNRLAAVHAGLCATTGEIERNHSTLDTKVLCLDLRELSSAVKEIAIMVENGWATK